MMEQAATALRAEGFDYLPGITAPSAVYALVDRGVVIYVGQAKNVYQRLTTHMNAKRRGGKKGKTTWGPRDINGKPFSFDAVLVKWTPMAELDRVERELILRLRPKYNERVIAPIPRVRVDLLGLGLMARRAPSEVRRRRWV